MNKMKFTIETGCVLTDKYLLLVQIGQGAFSLVWLCYDFKDKIYVVIKIHNADDDDMGVMEKEVLQKVGNHDCVNSHITSFWINNHVCIVYPLMAGSIHECLRYGKYRNGFTLPIAKQIVKQLLQGLKHLNSKSLIHADVKTDNILLVGQNKFVTEIIALCDPVITKNKNNRKVIISKINKLDFDSIKNKYSRYDKSDDEIKTISYIDDNLLQDIKVKLSDFGTCRNMPSDNSIGFQTRHYRSPELLLGYPYDERIDIWSVGCVIYELITGKLLFDPQNNKHFLNKQHICDMISHLGPIPNYLIENATMREDLYKQNYSIHNVYNIPYKPLHELYEFDDETIDILYLTLNYDPYKRPTIDELLSHPWFVNE